MTSELNDQNQLDFNILDEQTPEYIPASRPVRLLNYIIDFIFFYFMTGFVVSVITVVGLGSIIQYVIFTSPTLFMLIYVFSYGLFMGAMEAVTKGRSLGKLITKTKVVFENGESVDIATAFKRGMCRLVPFEVFSAFGGDYPWPWHDSWTKTYVVGKLPFKV